MHVDILAGDLHFAEGPRWHQGKLWFSDFYDHAVKTVDLAGNVESKLTVAGQPSGLGWLPDGRLLAVSMLDRRVLRLDDDGLVVHADLSDVATFHCNDMVVDAVGRAYVGNFGFDLDAAETSGDFAGALARYEGATIARVDPDGSVHVAATGMRFPNGSVLTPDGRTMVVAESMARRLTAFDVAVDGSLTNQRVWAQFDDVVPDGICLDDEGAMWVADAAHARCVRTRMGGELVAEVATQDRSFACMLGGDDGRTLFMVTAEHSHHAKASVTRTGRILSTRVDAPHAGCP